MLDVATGDLEIESLPIRIGSQFTRQQFLASDLAEHAQILVQNEPYYSFSAGSYELVQLGICSLLVPTTDNGRPTTDDPRVVGGRWSIANLK
jgi:hypothetical protein